MKKRQILSILLASAMVMSMTACGGSNSSSDSSDASSTSSSNTKSDDSSSGDKKKITITWRDDGTDIKVNPNYVAMQEAYENWDKKDEVELDFQPITASEGDYFTKIALQLGDSSTCPDLVCEDTFQLPNDVAAGYLTDLSDYVSDWDTWNDGTFYDKMKEVVTTDGKVYGIPYGTDTRGLWYNREILTTAGVIAEGEDWQPKTWDDILDACAKIKDKCPDVVPFWCNSGVATGEATSMQTYEMLLYGTGERLITDDGKWITDSQGIKDSLQFISDIYTNGYGPSLSLVLNGSASTTSAQEYIPQEKLAISLDGIWITGNWKDTGASPYENYGEKMGWAAMPTQNGDGDGSITLAGGWAYSIPENSDNKDLTMEFIEQLNTYDAYKTYIMQSGNTSVRTDIAEDEEYASQPFMTQAAEFLDVAAFRPQNDQYSTVSTSIQQMVEAVASGDTPENAMKQYATSVANAVGEENTTKQ